MLQSFPSIDERVAQVTAVLQTTHPNHANEIQVVVSPYRICPLGAHVDHQGGRVLARPIDAATILAFIPLDRPDIQLCSLDFDTAVHFPSGAPVEQESWARYAQAAALALCRVRPLTRGLAGVLSGSLIGAGLSSSASVGLAYLSALAAVNEIILTPAELVELDRIVENEYLGLPNGILDPSAIVYGQADSLLQIHTVCRQVSDIPDPVEATAVCWLLIYSGIGRTLTNTSFGQRVAECRRAAKWLSPTATILADVPEAVFLQLEATMPALLRRRAAHFYTEVARVKQGAVAWEMGDFAQFGALMNASCASSIQQYECGHQAIIGLHQLAGRTPGVYGSRFSGGGYGGCVLALVQAEQAETAAQHILAGYWQQFPELAERAAVFQARPVGGLHLL
jgi:galactokinase